MRFYASCWGRGVSTCKPYSFFAGLLEPVTKAAMIMFNMSDSGRVEENKDLAKKDSGVLLSIKS